MTGAACWFLLLIGAAAQTPRVANVQLETRASTSLAVELRTAQARNQPLWIGYAVESIRESESCCHWNGRPGCLLEKGSGQAPAGAAAGPVQLEASRYAMVLLRLEAGRVSKVQHFSLGCELDAGGLPLLWLTGVSAPESLELLRSQVNGVTVNGAKPDGPLGAIAVHKSPAADRILEGFLASGQPEEIRRKACFWMGSSRGAAGQAALERVLREDPSDRVREQAVFALTLTPQSAGLDAVLRAAREDRSPRVRSQAWFWLAQKAGDKAVGPIAAAIESDPEVQVKKQAVFALTQIPDGQGVPKLIEIARGNRDPAVRKQAFFWLGQSKDARAQQYLEDVLTK